MIQIRPVPVRGFCILVGGLLWAVGGQPAVAQGTRADYERAAKLRETTANRVFRDRVEPHWLPGGRQFWYRVRTARDQHEYVLVDAERAVRQPAFDHGRLAEAWNQAGAARVDAARLPIEELEFPENSPTFDFRMGDQWWRCNRETYQVERRPTEATPPAPGGAQEPGAAAERPTASQRTGPETRLTFLNRTPGEVQLFWLDSAGQRKSYGKIPAGQEHEQHTFGGHAWLLVDAQGRELGAVEASDDPGTVTVQADRVVRSTGNPARRAEGGRRRSRRQPSGRGAASPDGRWLAFMQEDNVWLRSTTGGEPLPLSRDGTPQDSYGDEFYWSPDSQKLVAVRTQPGEEHKVYFVESSPRDQVQPKLHSHDYAKPGDRIPLRKPQLFDVAGRRQLPVSDELFPNPWSVEEIRWARDSSRFTFVYNQRGHQVLRLLAVDAVSGSVQPLIDERSETFIDYSGKYFLHYLDDTGEAVWMSERDGWNHLYLIDAVRGVVKNQITRGAWVVRHVDRVDEETRQIQFRAGGIVPGQDPYYLHVGRVNMDGTGLVVLTAGHGTHRVEFSPDGQYLVDTYSRVDLPPVHELRRAADGHLVCELERADDAALRATGWRPPERFAAKGRDGTTDIYGVIYRPSNFDPGKKYPVIENIYAGPQDAHVPKSFQPASGAWEMAELGFVVVQIDGMGTSYRSKKFHDLCWKNLADAGFPDRILWIRAAAEHEPAMDLTRVGIYGGSAGGQNAAGAVMKHGDFYRVAVADCGCHDNRMDKIWWNEQWMGWPVGPEYAANSNVTLAPGLQGKLLLIVGEMDTNVDPASTMQVVHALIQADKDFDLLVIPGTGHGAAETRYGSRRRADYFVRHLLGVEPRR